VPPFSGAEALTESTPGFVQPGETNEPVAQVVMCRTFVPKFIIVPAQTSQLTHGFIGNLWGKGVNVMLFASVSPQKAPHIPFHHRISQRPTFIQKSFGLLAAIIGKILPYVG
jgi:hypothetical protein